MSSETKERIKRVIFYVVSLAVDLGVIGVLVVITFDLDLKNPF